MMMSTSEHWISVKNGSTSSNMIILSRLSSRRFKHSSAFVFVYGANVHNNKINIVDHVVTIIVYGLSTVNPDPKYCQRKSMRII